jgi:hypothetical protein
MLFAGKQIELVIMMLSEISQSQKTSIACFLSCGTWGKGEAKQK